MNNFVSISWKQARQMVENNELEIIGSNLSQINNQGEFSITPDKAKLYKRRHSSSKVVFDLIAQKSPTEAGR